MKAGSWKGGGFLKGRGRTGDCNAHAKCFFSHSKNLGKIFPQVTFVQTVSGSSQFPHSSSSKYMYLLRNSIYLKSSRSLKKA